MSRRSDIAGRVFSRLSAAGLVEESTLQRKDAAAAVAVSVVLRRGIKREGADGEIYVQTEITGLASELGSLERGDIFVINGERWLVDAPARNTGYILSALVVPDTP